MRAAGAATILFDLNLNKRVGTTSAPADPADDPGQGEAAVRLRRHGDRLRPPADRRERALRRANTDTVEHDERASTARTCCCSCRSSRARCDTCDHDREPAVHGRRGGRLVARGGEGGDPDSPGLLHLARPEGPLQARPRACEPLDAEGHARLDLALLRDRHPGRPGRARAAVPVRGRAGWPSGAAAAFGVARVREARDARGEAGRRRDEDPGRLVVGLAELLHRGRRPRQGRGGVRVPLDARPEAVRRPEARRASRSTRRSPRGRSRCRPACAARSAGARS